MKDYHTFEVPEGQIIEVLDNNQQIEDLNETVTICQGIIEIIWKSIPAIIMIFSVNGILIVDTLFFGFTKDSVNFSGWGLGVSIICIVILSLNVGAWDGMEALVSKAYGRKDYESWEIHLNQWRYMLLLLSIPQFIIFLFLEHIFNILGQPSNVAHSSWIFCMLSFLGIISMSLFELNRRYLVCWEVNYSGSILTVSVFILHILLLYISVVRIDSGVYGAGIWTTISFSLDFILFEVECWFQKEEVHKSRWRMPSGVMLTRLKEFVKHVLKIDFNKLSVIKILTIIFYVCYLINCFFCIKINF